MTYRFKSKTTGDLLMLAADGRRLLQIIGKDPAPSGIILPEQMPAAIQALEAAIAREEAQHALAFEPAKAEEEASPRSDEVSLRQRAGPLIDMLGRCAGERVEVVWGV